MFRREGEVIVEGMTTHRCLTPQRVPGQGLGGLKEDYGKGNYGR